MYLFIVRFSLILEIFLDHFLISILSYGVHIVTACPKFSAPKQPFYLGMKPKNLFCRNTFNSTDYLFGGIRWYTLNQKMDVVSILSLIHISEPTRRTPISYAVFCLKKKNATTRSPPAT